MLRRAAGAPVSYAQLHHAGIEFPASVVSELELAGLGVERCHVHARGERQLVGVRLQPPRERSELAGERPELAARRSELAARSSVPVLRGVRTSAARALRTLGDNVATRWFPPAALLAAGGVVAALALIALSGGGRTPRVAVAHHRLRPAASAAARSQAAAASKAGAAVVPQPRPVPRAAPAPVSPALAAQLEAQGHELLGAGRYSEAIPVLERTLPATGENLRDCLQPASETCLTYAYALYDLGKALRLDRDPAAAVPVLRRRLQIENQRPTVQAQLELALAQAS